MKIVFMGTPDFAVPSLEKLIQENYEIAAVFTQPDKPKGRGHKLAFSPVKEMALKYNLPIYQPDSLKEEAVQKIISDIEPDFIVVVAYGKILPKAVLDIPKFGCINVHGSLLPKYRGAAPIQQAVLNGESVTGITTMYMGTKLDTGDMLLKAETEIGENETSEELFDRLKDIGADLLSCTLTGLIEGTITPEVQDDSKSSYTSVITKQLSPIDWNKSNTEIHNQIRGLNSWPSATSVYNGKTIKIHRTLIKDGFGKPGELYVENGSLCVYCGTGSLEITELQMENGKRMSGKSFLLGHPLNITMTLGN